MVENDKTKIASPTDKKLWSGTGKPAGEEAAKSPDDKAAAQTSSHQKKKGPKRKPNTELNGKQKKFVQEYMKEGNATQAAQKAGYSEKTAEVQGCRLLKNVKIREYLGTLQKKAQERALVSFDDILKDVLTVKERCMQEVKPLTDKKGEQIMVEDAEGNPCPAYVFDSNGTLKALDMAAKLLGMYPAEKKDITVNKPVVFEGEDKLS